MSKSKTLGCQQDSSSVASVKNRSHVSAASGGHWQPWCPGLWLHHPASASVLSLGAWICTSGSLSMFS